MSHGRGRGISRALLATTLIIGACTGDVADDDDTTGPEWDEVTVEDVIAVVEGGCTDGGLASLQGAQPAAVREALVAADLSFKLDAWTPGLSHGNPVGELGLRTDLLDATAFDYSLYVPDEYTADPNQPLPLFLDPGHPADELQSEIMPYKADLLDQPFFFVQDNMFNRLYTELGDEEYYDQVVYADEFELVAAYQDHEQIIAEILRQLRRHYFIDSSRIYTGGVSAEGNAAWSHGMLSTDQYAAILPVSAGTAGFHEDLWRNLETMGMLVVHGTDDDLCPVEDVDEAVEMLQGWGFDVEYWREEGEGHGTMFYGEFADMVDWLLLRQRPLDPSHVRRAIKSDRDTDAYWLAGLDVSADPAALIHVTAPPSRVEGLWQDGVVDIQAAGVGAVEIRWLEGPSGPASGSAGDALGITVNGADLGGFTLDEDPTVAVEDYCRHADISRTWAGKLTVDVP
jgi:predicted esterase